MNIHELFEDKAKKQRLDPKCWTGYHKAGTKVKGGVRVNNCVPNNEAANPAQQAAIAIAKKKEQGVAEGTGNLGASIRALCQKIYNAGDDEFEYFYNDSPVFAQYWDEYEGDLDSIIAEVDPKELQIIHDELKSYVDQARLAEGELDEKSVSRAQFRTMAAAAHNPEFAKKVGIKPSVAKEFHKADKSQSYKSLPKKVDEGKGDYVPPKEADYGDEYQAMVKRVGQKARQQELAKQKAKQKKEDSNMPVAVDSTSPIHGTNEDSEGVSTKNISPASQKLIQKARQAAPDARSDLDAVFAYLDDVAKRTQDNYSKVNDILQQLDPMSNDLDQAERELDRVRQVNQGQQQLLGRLKSRLDKTGADTAPAQAQQDKRDADERNAIGQQLAQEPQQVVVKQEPQGPVDAVDKVARQKADQAERDIHNLYSKDASSTASKTINQIQQRMLTPPSDPKIDPSTTVVNPDKIKALAKNFLQKDEITEDIYESRLYKMKLAGYFD